MKKIIAALLGVAAALGIEGAARGGVHMYDQSGCYYDYWDTGDYLCAIYVMNADRSVVASVWGTGPVWAPERSRLAFTGTGERDVFSGPSEIFVLNLDDGSLTNLTNHPANDSAISWSPDGARIAFWSDRDGQGAHYVMKADGAGVTRLPKNFGGFTWSPDGDRIAGECVVESSNVDICVSGADGTGLVRLTTEPARDAAPDWSPDGARIAFGSDRDGQAALYVMNADGSGVTRLAGNIRTNNGGPRWSPDGRRIAFTCTVEGSNLDICVVNADGTGFTRLTSDPAWENFAGWSPSGRLIAFTVPFSGMCSDYCSGDTYVMNADGTGRVIYDAWDFWIGRSP